MKRTMIYLVLAVGMAILLNAGFVDQANALSPEEMVEKIQWYGAQSSIRIDAGGKVIYIDPYKIPAKNNDADIILITHKHDDHYSTSQMDKIAKEGTVFIAPKGCGKWIDKKFKTETILSEPGMKTDVGGIQIEAVPAYNIRKTQYHPKQNKWVGYILTIEGVRIYHAGDTERIPEMKTFTCDIALLPLGQKYTMNKVDDAAEAALDVKAKIAIPMHFGMFEGSKKDADKFAKLLDGKVKVIRKERIKK
ncbi:MBL fold metallo-hydrolase [Thermodesulfobacteriota bacterium]